MTALPDSTRVLIVGGGPTGVTTALSLLHRGCRDFLIVDAAPEGERTSRAATVHAATLELLDTIGCGEDIASQGEKIGGIPIGTRSGPLIYPDYAHLKKYTRYPYALHIPQYLTENLLGAKLASYGVSVHRPLNVVGMKRNTENAQLTDVMFEDGRAITARYVVGADGAHSVVRTTAGIAFTDPIAKRAEKATHLAQTVLADVTFDAPLEGAGAQVTMSPEGTLVFGPLPATYNEHLIANGHPTLRGKLFRIASGVPLEEGEIPFERSKEYLQKIIDRFAPYRLSSDPLVNPKPIRVKDVVWSSRFRHHSAISETTFTRLVGSGDEPGGAILLVGDAAHVHSPIGGQGMNLGIRDAIFLGEALTKHMHATETKSLSEADMILEDFAATRRAQALEVIGLTKGMLSLFATKHRDWVYWWLPISTTTVRNWAMWVGNMFPFVRRQLAWELSGLGRK